MKAGDRIDVLDTEHIWCSAVVELKIKTAEKPPLLYIHYEGWNRKYDEYLFISNRRLAPNGTYTKRNDIPRYKLDNHLQEVRYAHVLESGRAQLNDLPDIRHVPREELRAAVQPEQMQPVEEESQSDEQSEDRDEQ